MLFRRVDDDNCWKLVCTQADSTIKLYKREGGTDTEVDSGKTNTWTNNTAYRIYISPHASSIKTYVGTIIKHNYAADAFQSTAVSAVVSGFTTAANLIIWNRYPANIPFTSRPVGMYMGMGDSKSTATWQPYFSTNTNRNQALQLATSGHKLADRAATIVADLIGNPTTEITHVFCNYGANDVMAMPAEATWIANYQLILDTIHTRWPNAHVYITRAWRRGKLTDCNTLAGWIDTIVASRSTFVHLGDDERVWMENGDDGVTYTSDGIHPNAAGYALAAAQKESVSGL